MRRLAGLCVLGVLALGLPACASSHPAQRGQLRQAGTQISTRRVSSSRLILGGRVRCTATVTTPVEAGHEIGIDFSLHNISAGSVRAPLNEEATWMLVRAADGTRYDTRAALSAEGSLGGPFRMPLAIPPGATRTMVGPRVFARWAGPLRITPGCEKTALPSLHVTVASPGPPADTQTAVDDVVAATGGLLDRCRPRQPGVSVDGEIDPPGESGPSMDARCSVSLQPEGRFLVAHALVLIPRDMRGVRIRQPYETLSFPKRPRPYEAIAWELVVTRDGAVTVGGFTHDATRAGNRMAPEWTWSGSRWSQPGSARCGFEGFSAQPMLDLVSVCPS